MTGSPPVVVLDDDPTGTQSATGVPVLLRWGVEDLRRAARAGPPALYLLTNTRAYSPERAYRVVREATVAARQALATPRVVLRGDSTLRGHLLEEYRGVRDAIGVGDHVLLLVPSMPHAGRVTLGGVHYLQRDGRRIPLHETEYAHDRAFGYADARLAQWAQDRSEGLFPAAAAVEIELTALRRDGAAGVADALGAAIAPAVCVPDVETDDDLAVLADGVRLAEQRGAHVLTRCAPPFAAVLGGCLATGYAPPPTAVDGLLVVCGSYVATTTRQLAHLTAAYPRCLVEADIDALAACDPAGALAHLAGEVDRRLARDGLAVLATARGEPAADATAERSERIARNLAGVVPLLRARPDVVLTKGGITGAVTVQEGLRAAAARVLGPIAPGVVQWLVDTPWRPAMPVVVFPGNLGDDAALLDTVRAILDGSD